MKLPRYDPAWSDDVKALYHHDMREIWDRNISRHVWNQYHNQLDLYLSITGEAAHGKGIKILDIGCAQGTLALLLAERGHQVCAVDLRPQFLEYARTRYTHGDIRFILGNALELELDEHFDLIFANQIIEHLVYPNLLVQRLRHLLVPGGTLVMSTPNWSYFINTTLPSYKDLGDPSLHEHLQFSADGDGHFFAYRGNELVKIFQQEGLKAIRLSYFETPFISGHFKVRHLHRVFSVDVLRWLDRLLLSIPGVRRTFAHQLLITGVNPRDGAVLIRNPPETVIFG